MYNEGKMDKVIFVEQLTVVYLLTYNEEMALFCTREQYKLVSFYFQNVV